MPLDLLEALHLLELDEGVDEGEGFERGVFCKAETAEDGGDLVQIFFFVVAEEDGVGEAPGGDECQGEGGVVFERVGAAEGVAWVGVLV